MTEDNPQVQISLSLLTSLMFSACCSAVHCTVVRRTGALQALPSLSRQNDQIEMASMLTIPMIDPSGKILEMVDKKNRGVGLTADEVLALVHRVLLDRYGSKTQ
jgi:hypothetical protein